MCSSDLHDLVAELERNLRLLDEVVRFQTVLLAEDIDPASVSVDPEDLQYLHVEDVEETEDAEAERARSLGMGPRTSHEDRRGEDADESGDSDDDAEASKAEDTNDDSDDSDEGSDESSDEDEREEG